MGSKPTKNHSIDRIDNNGDYTPDNCRWATQDKQQSNKSNNVFLTHDGESLTIAEWSRKIDMPFDTLWKRLKLGWTTEDALLKPVKIKHRRKKNANI